MTTLHQGFVILFFALASLAVAGAGANESSCPQGKLDTPWVEKSSASKRLVQNTNCNRPLIEGERSICERGSEAIITYTMLYYRDSIFLEEQKKNWCGWPRATRQKFQFLIIDDGSPAEDSAIQKYVHNGCINLMVYTIQKDLHWNIGGARNLAFHVAPTDYVLLTDSDLLVPHTIALACLEMVRSDKNSASKQVSESHVAMKTIFLSFNRVFNESGQRRPHPATMMLTKDTYWMCGGCDEDFVGGYGMTDPHFKWRAARTKNVEVSNVSDKYDDELIMMELKEKLSIQRDPESNRNIFKAKRLGKMPWSNNFIRFPWKHTAQFCIKE